MDIITRSKTGYQTNKFSYTLLYILSSSSLKNFLFLDVTKLLFVNKILSKNIKKKIPLFISLLKEFLKHKKIFKTIKMYSLRFEKTHFLNKIKKIEISKKIYNLVIKNLRIFKNNRNIKAKNLLQINLNIFRNRGYLLDKKYDILLKM